MNELEQKAVDLLSAEFVVLMKEQRSIALFEEDDAIDLLVHNGIRPSRLGLDLQWIISIAQRQAMKEAVSWRN